MVIKVTDSTYHFNISYAHSFGSHLEANKSAAVSLERTMQEFLQISWKY